MYLHDVFYKVGNIEPYKKTFFHRDNKIEEILYSHVKEIISENPKGVPEKIKVLQIHDLEDYLGGNKEDVTEREITIRTITPLSLYGNKLV